MKTRPASMDHMMSEPEPVSDGSLEGGPDLHRSKTAELFTSTDCSTMQAANQAIRRSPTDASISAATEGEHDVHSVSSIAAPGVAKQDECNTNGLLTPVAHETKHQQSGGPTSSAVISVDDIDSESIATQ